MLPTEHTRQAINRDCVLGHIEWLRRAKKGWKQEYHHGCLMCDRETEPLTHMIGRVFWAAAEAGLVMLTQRTSVDPEAHTYIATRTGVRLSVRIRAGLEQLVNEEKEDAEECQNADGRGGPESQPRPVLPALPSRRSRKASSDVTKSEGGEGSLGR